MRGIAEIAAFVLAWVAIAWLLGATPYEIGLTVAVAWLAAGHYGLSKHIDYLTKRLLPPPR